VVLPQIIFGVLTVLVLYRAVRRLAGVFAGLVAAVVLAATPVTVLMGRGNVADSVLILLTVLAADAASSALVTGRRRTLLLAGFWLGLAFQAKMLQAWMVAPPLALAYLVAAPQPLRRRAGDLAIAGALMLVVSLSWMTVVSLVPTNQRPYVDGSTNDSLFAQVFDYNGFGRMGVGPIFGAEPTRATFVTQLQQETVGQGIAATKVKASWHRLLGGLLARDAGWLLPAALAGLLAMLAETRRRGRGDPLRALVILWGIWLLILWVLFSGSDYDNSYYMAALSPGLAALCGGGAAVFLRRREQALARACLAATLLACAGYGVYLLNGGSEVPGWLAPVGLVIGAIGAIAALLWRRLRVSVGAAAAATAAVLACALPLPGVTSALMVTRDLGPFASPYQAGTAATASAFAATKALEGARTTVESFASHYGTPIPFAIDTAVMAGPYVFATGQEILPIGGFRGGVPSPTLAQLQGYIAADRVAAFLLPVNPPSTDPRVQWVQAHCAKGELDRLSSRITLGVYDCAGR
jgi:4-amino-4-deoxy-L-arabinose transferase-like glycosyltransferase